jgi:hypothetical protein
VGLKRIIPLFILLLTEAGKVEYIPLVPVPVELLLDQLDNPLLFGLDTSLFLPKSIELCLPLCNLLPMDV